MIIDSIAAKDIGKVLETNDTATMMLTVVLAVLLSSGVLSIDPANIIEGDIVVDQETQNIMDGIVSAGYDGQTSRRWPNGVIPYVFDSRFDASRRQVVQRAIAEYKAKTCIRFIPRTNQRNYVRFMIGGGCYSMIGMTGRGRQDISIGNGCQRIGTVIHEMMHAAGFFHEQSRRDRDNFITIYWNNIRRGMEYNFKKYSHGTADTFGQPYDMDSVMHYGKYAFSVNRMPTIVAKGDPNRQLGQRTGFSKIDVIQLNKMYGCSGGTTPTSKPSGCTDMRSGCTAWAQQGFCTKGRFVDYMKKNCCKACQGTTGTSNCKNDHQLCAFWASVGECKKNPTYMLKKCKKSCKTCT